MGVQNYVKAVAASLLLAAASASATIVEVGQGLGVDQLYGSNNGSLSYGSSFNAAKVLGTSSFGSDYRVNAASLRFNWTDNGDDPYSLVSSTGLVNTYGSWPPRADRYGQNLYRTVTGSETTTWATQAESASVALSGTTFVSPQTVLNATTNDAVSRYITFERSDSRQVSEWRLESYPYSYSCGFLGWDTCYGTRTQWVKYSYTVTDNYYSYHTDTRTTIRKDYTGSFSIDIDLMAFQEGLDDLLDDGVLGFTLAMNGNAFLKNALLTLDVTRNETPAQVPEPGAMALLGLGLAGLAWSRRRTPVALRTARR